MNSKIKEIILRLLSFRNIVPLLIIIGAFVGTFVPTPFGLGRDQLLLGLLAFLAIDALIERLELLTNIEKDVRALKESIASRTATKDFLRRRKDFPRLEHLITEARKEVWVSGISLDTMATLVGVFNSKLKEGLNLRFLSVSLQKRVIQDTSGYIGRDVDELEGRIRANLGTLCKALAPTHPQQVEIRTIGYRPALGYFIVDPYSEKGYMTIQNYLYQGRGSDVYPLLLVSKETDPFWFDIYLRDFDALWNDAMKWELGESKKQDTA